MGDLRCAQLPNRFQGPYTYPRLDGYTTINVSSGSPQPPMRALSPMKLGPFRVIETMIHEQPDPGFSLVVGSSNKQEIQATSLENWWQFSKIYNIDVIDGVTTSQFFIRRGRGILDSQSHRRAMPKSKGHPVASFFDGQVYGYLPARIGWYCPTYQMLVENQPAFQSLCQRHLSGENLLIIGPDGRDIGPITTESLTQAILDPQHIFGHELVLCGMLLGVCPWANPEVRQSVGLA